MIGVLNNTIVELIGALTRRFATVAGSYTRFIFAAYRCIFTRRWNYRLIMDQMMTIGIKSLPVALTTAVFVGLVMVLQTGVQLTKFGAKTFVPAISFIANARELIPVFIAFVVGARVTASIAAEIGTMRVTEQIDAMDILNVDPYNYLVAPRVIAMTIMLPIITLFCLVASFFGGMIIGSTVLGINPTEYFNVTLKFAYLTDVYSGLFKTIFFGKIIALVGCFFGFNTKGGAEGVGRATTTSVVVSLMLILLIDFMLTRWILIIYPVSF